MCKFSLHFVGHRLFYFILPGNCISTENTMIFIQDRYIQDTTVDPLSSTWASINCQTKYSRAMLVSNSESCILVVSCIFWRTLLWKKMACNIHQVWQKNNSLLFMLYLSIFLNYLASYPITGNTVYSRITLDSSNPGC